MKVNAEVLKVLEAKGWPLAKIGRFLGVSHQLVSYHLRRSRVVASRRRSSRRSSVVVGRRRRVAKLLNVVQHVEGRRWTPKLRKLRKRSVVRRPFRSPSLIARALGADGFVVSPSTVRRDLCALGYKAYRQGSGPFLTAQQMQRRVEFCKWFLSYGKSLLFSDEKYFSSDECNSGWQWCKTRDDVDHIVREQDHYKILVWSCIGIGFRHIIVFSQPNFTVTKKNYVPQILQPTLPKLKSKCKNEYFFQQDGARGHIGGVEWLRSKGVQCIDNWPPRSCDLSVIENLWGWLAKRVSERGPWGEEQLRDFVVEEFNKIPQESIDSLVLSFEERCKECVKKNGGLVKPPKKPKKQ